MTDTSDDAGCSCIPQSLVSTRFFEPSVMVWELCVDVVEMAEVISSPVLSAAARTTKRDECTHAVLRFSCATLFFLPWATKRCRAPNST